MNQSFVPLPKVCDNFTATSPTPIVSDNASISRQIELMDVNDLRILPNQFAVGKAEFATGIILKKDGYYYNINDDLSEVYDVFENFEAAKEFAIEKVQKNQDIECLIMNHKNEIIFVFDKNGERNYEKPK